MHEMSIAISIVEAVCQQAQKEKAEKIQSIELVIGKLAAIEPESLKFCFSAAAKGTLAEDAALMIEEPEGIGKCEECGKEFAVNFYYAECPQCKSFRIAIVSGEEFKIQAMEIE